jgi:hypothetical protein
MKLLRWIAVIFAPVMVFGQTATDYRAAIRDAIENTREVGPGHYVSAVPSRVFISLITGLPLKQSSELFSFEPFTLRSTTSESLHSATPNQSMQLTPSRTAFTFDHD